MTVQKSFVVSEVHRLPADKVLLVLSQVLSITGPVTKIPVAKTEEEKIMERMITQVQETLGFQEMMRAMQGKQFDTKITLERAEYESLGKPTVGDLIAVTVKKEKVAK